MSRPLPVLAKGEILLPDRGLYITPSDINPWRGLRHPTELFTGNQLHVMPSYNLDPATCDYVLVRQRTSMREYYAYTADQLPIYVMPCPIISQPQTDGRLLVIAPAGMKKLVYPDGSITKQRTPRRQWRRA